MFTALERRRYLLHAPPADLCFARRSSQGRIAYGRVSTRPVVSTQNRLRRTKSLVGQCVGCGTIAGPIPRHLRAALARSCRWFAFVGICTHSKSRHRYPAWRCFASTNHCLALSCIRKPIWGFGFTVLILKSGAVRTHRAVHAGGWCVACRGLPASAA